MGDGADYYNEGPELEPSLITRSTEWTTKEGQKVRICDMESNHLLNAIRVLRDMSPIGTTFKTSPERRRQWLNAMANEAYQRGLLLDPLTEGEPIHE